MESAILIGIIIFLILRIGHYISTHKKALSAQLKQNAILKSTIVLQKNYIKTLENEIEK